MMQPGIGPENIQLLEELYNRWKENPEQTPEDWADLFREWDSTGGASAGATSMRAEDRNSAYKQSRVNSLIWSYRDVGYLYAQLNPLKGYMPKELEYVYKSIEGMYETLSLKEFDLEASDLETEFASSRHLEPGRARLREIIQSLKDTYCSYLGVEFLHIQNKPIRRWLIRKIESGNNKPALNTERKRTVQDDLIKAFEFESFLNTHFVGQKRFSVEGGEVIIPALHYLIDKSASNDIEEIVLGMSHRGRLNVLANIIGKPLEQVFSTFEKHDESPTYGGSGDVKYHIGYSRDHVNEDGTKIHVGLVANPSHLESIDPVVQGKARSIQRKRNDKNRKKVIPVLLHGDAAFSGQGVVSETFNLSKLKGYETGGTIHIIVNNQIGFTTASRDLRSTFFPTDTAKALAVPIFHVNGDQPEYVLRAIDLAFDYRQKFGYDAIVDIFCYRKYGHNEADDPSYTHPRMYNLIKQSPGVTALYGETLENENVYSQKEQDDFKEKYKSDLRDSLEKSRKKNIQDEPDGYRIGEWKNFKREYSHDPVHTGIEETILSSIFSTITTAPENFEIHPTLERINSRRIEMVSDMGAVDWATAEAIAFGSLLLEGIPIRLSGEDSGRGTFSQRHAIWWNTAAGQPRPYIPLNHLSSNQADFAVHDSPLSEFSVLGFEFGFSITQPNVLVIWEAQFGDFCNGAQVIIDQFIAASETKWDRSSGLVMLLPHGYEGQGPEHSSGFLERFLQLCAQDNIQVCNVTTPAQYFHLLRRQMKRDFRKPLIIMTPKSLLRRSEAVSALPEFTAGPFREVLFGGTNSPENAEAETETGTETVILCAGKIYYDLLEERKKLAKKGCPILRIEQFYPYPENQIETALKRYPGIKEIRWVQEETRNRGGWMFMSENLSKHIDVPLRYIGRPAKASPASGSFTRHMMEQEKIAEEAFS